MALSLVIHQMAVIPKPKAILSFYAVSHVILPIAPLMTPFSAQPLMLQTRGSASRLMTAVDTLLPLGVLLSCLEAYSPNCEETSGVNSDEDFEDFIRLSNEDIPQQVEQWSPSLSLRVKHSIHSLKERLVGEPESPLRPWYRHSDNLEEKLRVVNHVTGNPFISPLLSTSLPPDIPLYLIGLHFDACLDDSIQMAKYWRGPVVLDVIDGLPHGFLNFVALSAESKRASDLCLDRIKQSLH